MNRPYTYIAADWEHDHNAVEILRKWNDSSSRNFSFLDAHDLQQARDSSLNCSIKASLSARLEKSYRFIIVGNNTKNLPPLDISVIDKLALEGISGKQALIKLHKMLFPEQYKPTASLKIYGSWNIDS